MKWMSVKTVPANVLAGVKVTAESVDGNFTSFLVEDAKGGRLLVTLNSYQGMRVSIPAPPTMVKRFRVEGTAGAGTVPLTVESRTFQHDTDARDHLAELKDLYRDFEGKVVPVEVAEEEVEAKNVEQDTGIPF